MAKKDRVIQLPEDAAYLPDFEDQWWYWSGRFKAKGYKGPFGFHLVFMINQIENGKKVLTQAHFTLTRPGRHPEKARPSKHGLPQEEENPKFLFDFHRNAPEDAEAVKKTHGRNIAKNGGGDHVFDLMLKSAKGTRFVARGDGEGKAHLEIDFKGEDAFALELDIERDPKRVVKHFDGRLEQFPLGETHYYSRRDQIAAGSLRLGGNCYQIKGETWFDRQFGSLKEMVGLIYEWVTIDLGHEQVMLCQFHDHPRASFGGSNLGGTAHKPAPWQPLDDYEFRIKELTEWQSPHSRETYPMGWLVEIYPHARQFVILPLRIDQEIHSGREFAYWEGICQVLGIDGKRLGWAHVETQGIKPEIASRDGMMGRS